MRAHLCFLFFPALLLATPGAGVGQVVSGGASLSVAEAELVEHNVLRLRFDVGGERDSVDIPQSLLADLAVQMRKSARPPSAPVGTTQKAERPATRHKRALAQAHSAVTGQNYDVEILADSLVTIEYQEGATNRVVSLPVDILGILYGHHEVLSGRMARETQVYLEPGSGAFWLKMARGFNYKFVVLVLGLLAAALVFVVVRISTRRIKRERDELRASRRRMLRIREAERSHLASELHDGPVQDVQRILRSNLSSLARVIPTSETDDLTELESTLRQVAGSLRNICTDLKPPVLTHFGLEKAAESCARAFQLRNPDIKVQEEFRLGLDDMSDEARLVAYRILQEALTNVEKHARARTVRIELHRRGGEVRLVVEDDGKGFRVTSRFLKLEERGHFGLSGMRHRVDSVGGMLYVESTVGKGTRITALVPADVTESLDLSSASPLF